MGGMSRNTMFAAAVEVMEVMHREGHTVRSALADLGTTPKPGRGATWEDVVRRIFWLMEQDAAGNDPLEPNDVAPELAAAPPEPVKTVVVRLPTRAVKKPPSTIVRATPVAGPVVFDDSRKMAGRG